MTTVTVKRVKNRSYPCDKCRFYNRPDFPKTVVHSQATRRKAYLSNLKAGQDQPYVEIVGECLDYTEKT